jgi:hypothetical protein
MTRPVYRATADFSMLQEAFSRTQAFAADLAKILDPNRDLPPLIAFGGKKEHGKDAAADMLVHHRQYVKTFMSEPLTAAVSLIGPRGPWVRLDHDELGYAGAGEFVRYADLVEAVGYTQAKEHRDAREYLQGLGTEVGRKMFHEDVWVDIAREKIQQARAAGSPVCITGIRYQNELELVHSLGGHTVWVERTSWPEKPAHPLTEAIDAALGEQEDTTATHSSETSLSAEDFDIFLENAGTLKHLQVNVLALHTELTQD